MDRLEIDRLSDMPLARLTTLADKVRRQSAGERLELCNIMNAKSGLCAEDCKFCAQSARHSTGAAAYPLRDKSEMLAAARAAREMGSHRFDIVTSGNVLTKHDLSVIVEAVREIREKIGIEMCASLGRLGEEALTCLKKAGLSRYHHNIETSPRYFKKIVSTHTFEERLDTIRAAKRAGLEVCSGGIIGMGETWADRIDIAYIDSQ